MRLVDIARASALIGFLTLLSACPKKDADVVPEPATTTTPQPNAASDKAGAEPPAAAAPAATPAATPTATPAAAPAAAAPVSKPKKKEDQGGW
jgi:hypothetical protein